jgi:hypothetical protein
VVNTAGGQLLGQARTDDDGANSVELTLQQAYWLDPGVATGQRGRIFLENL